MGTQGYIAPEILRGEEATPAADSYSLGVMFVYLLTGIWYEPGSKVFKLLETLEYRWIDVLPRLLAENPAERPTNLKELAAALRGDDAVVTMVVGEARAQSVLRRTRSVRPTVIAFAGAAVFVVAAIGFYFFSHRPTPPSTVDDLGEVFSSSGIYKAARP